MQNEDIGMKIWRVVYPPLIYILVNMVVQATMMVIITVNYTPGEVITDGQTIINNLNQNVRNYSNVASLISALITIPIIYRYSKIQFIIDLKKRITRSYIFLLPLAFLVNTGLSRLIGILSNVNISDNYEQIEKNLFSGSVAIQILTLVFVMPLMEEMIFRGLVYNRIKEYTNNKMTGAILSSAMFGLYHFDLLQGLYAFVLGLILVFIMEKFGTITAPILLHMMCNLFAIFLSYSGISAFFSQSILAYILLTFFELAGLAVIIFIINRRKV